MTRHAMMSTCKLTIYFILYENQNKQKKMKIIVIKINCYFYCLHIHHTIYIESSHTDESYKFTDIISMGRLILFNVNFYKIKREFIKSCVFFSNKK